jgi:6-phosphogluconolactonase/glucosamine-6-phosphate isomerase/deaminase
MLEVRTSNRPADEAHEALRDILKAEPSGPVLLLCSGGSALSILKQGVEPVSLSAFTLGVLDERYTFDQTVSNFTQLTHTQFFRTCTQNGAATIDPRPVEGDTLERAATRFDSALTDWHAQNPNGLVVATIGIGSDGHTAGVLPDPSHRDRFHERFVDTTRSVVGYEVAPEVNVHTERLTTTLAYLRNSIDRAIVYVVGTEKSLALQTLMAEQGSLATTPARILRDMRSVVIYTNITR